jgi:hypothetical protein
MGIPGGGRKRVRVGSKTLLSFLTLTFIESEAGFCPNSMLPTNSRIQDHHMLWLAGTKTPSNCVFFACQPETPAVLTS